MSETRTLKVVIAGDAKSARAALKTLGTGLDEADRKAKGSNERWSLFGDRFKQFGALAAGGLATAAAGVGVLGITTAANFEQMEVSFGTLLKSSDKAKSEMAWLSAKAAATPYELGDLTKADQTLLGFGMKSEQVRRDFVMNMGEMAAAVGLPSEQLPELATVFGQIHASGAVQLADVNQLINHGIPIWDMLSTVTGKNVKQLKEEISARKLSSSTFEKAVSTYTKSNFAGAMEKQSTTLAGLWSTLKDNVSMAAMKMVEPLVPLIKQWMPKLSDLAAKAGDAFTNKVIPAFKEVAKVVGSVVGWFTKHDTTAKALLVTIGLLIIATKAHALAMAIESAGGFLSYLKGMKLIQGATKVWAAVQWVLNAALNANPIGIVIIAVLALVAVIVYLFKHNKKFHDAVIAIWNAIKHGIGAAVNWLKVNVPKAWHAIVKGVMAYVNWWKGNVMAVFNGVKAYLSFVINAYKTIFTKGWGFIKDVFSGAVGWFKNAGGKIIDGLADGIRNGMGRVKDAVKDVLGAARRLLPFSPAKEGPFSGKGWTLYSGRSIMDGLADGMKQRRGYVKNAAWRGVNDAHSAVDAGLASRSLQSAPAGSGGGVSVVVNVRGSVTAERDLARSIAVSVRDEIARNGKRNGGNTGL